MSAAALLTISLSAFSQSCAPAGRPAGSPESARIASDSGYRLRLARWLRDSSVLDSITHVVRVDSLYQLYRRALEPSGASLAVVQAVFCEEIHLAIQYGYVPSSRAIQALRDTVYRDHGVREGFAYFAAHSPPEGHVAGGRSACGSSPAAAPSHIGQTRLDTPLPPKPHSP
jgi:hypothetical protein